MTGSWWSCSSVQTNSWTWCEAWGSREGEGEGPSEGVLRWCPGLSRPRVGPDAYPKASVGFLRAPSPAGNGWGGLVKDEGLGLKLWIVLKG